MAIPTQTATKEQQKALGRASCLSPVQCCCNLLVVVLCMFPLYNLGVDYL